MIAAEIVEDLQAALDEFALIAEDLRKSQYAGTAGNPRALNSLSTGRHSRTYFGEEP